MIGRALITDQVKRDIPKPQRLGRLQGRLVMSGDVLALDSQSIMIKDLVYTGGQPSTRFTLGKGSRPGPHGVALPDEDGSSRSLRAYRNRTIILTLPPSIDLQSMSWLAMWSQVQDLYGVPFLHLECSQELGSALAWLPLPDRLLVPPSPQALGISPQVLFFFQPHHLGILMLMSTCRPFEFVCAIFFIQILLVVREEKP